MGCRGHILEFHQEGNLDYQNEVKIGVLVVSYRVTGEEEEHQLCVLTF